MEYASIYRRFRPNTFDGVIGQKHIVRTLTNQIKNGNVGHAYLFTGTRGTGKTSCAKIFARAVNCLTPVNGSPCGKCAVCKTLEEGSGIDIIEMDAASNNGVDEIRALKENVMYRPTVGKYKVYIIDEVHMLTGSAFNALLKTLEEPPEHIIFILATTEVQKLPQTILSRCIRFDFRLVGVEELVGQLKYIFNELGVTYDERALTKIAVQGEGSVRDTLSIADMCMSYCGKHISYEDTLEVLCATDFTTLDRLASAILDGDVGTALNVADELLRNGRNTVAKDLANYYNDLISVKNVANYKINGITDTEYKILRARAEDYSNYRISRVMEIMAGMETQLRFASQPRILLEANVVKACSLATEVSVDGIVNRVKELETEISRLKESGIRVKESIPMETQPNKKVESSHKNDVSELLQKIATPEKIADESNLIFTAVEKEENTALALEIWSRVQERLDSSNEMTLRLICGAIEDGVSISGDDFILQTADKATYEMLQHPARREVLTKLIKETSGKNYNFICNMPNANKGISAASKVKINDMFNGQVKIKK